MDTEKHDPTDSTDEPSKRKRGEQDGADQAKEEKKEEGAAITDDGVSYRGIMVVDVYELRLIEETDRKVEFVKRVEIDNLLQRALPTPVNKSIPNDGLGHFVATPVPDDHNMLIQSVCAQPAFSSYSYEELRAKYYNALTTPSVAMMTKHMLQSGQFTCVDGGRHLVVSMPITNMQDFKYGNGGAVLCAVFSLASGKFLSDSLTPLGPIDWGISTGSTPFDYYSVANLAASLPRSFEDERSFSNRRDFEITSSCVMTKLATLYHLTCSKSSLASAVPPNQAGADWFSYDEKESLANITILLDFVRSYARRVFEVQDSDPGFTADVIDIRAEYSKTADYNLSPEPFPKEETPTEAKNPNVEKLSDLGVDLYVLRNALRLLKILVCKHNKYKVKALPDATAASLRSFLLWVVHAMYTPAAASSGLLHAVPTGHVLGIVKECCEIIVLGHDLLYPVVADQILFLRALLLQQTPNNRYSGRQLLIDMLSECHYHNATFAKWAFAGDDDAQKAAIPVAKPMFKHLARAFFAQAEKLAEVEFSPRTLTNTELLFMDMWKETIADTQASTSNTKSRAWLTIVTKTIAKLTTKLIGKCEYRLEKVERAIRAYVPPFFTSLTCFVAVNRDFPGTIGKALFELAFSLHQVRQSNAVPQQTDADLMEFQAKNIRESKPASLLFGAQLHWLLDFAKNVDYICGQCFVPLVNGVTLSTTSDRHELQWFKASSLFKGAFETCRDPSSSSPHSPSSSPFLDDYVNLTAGSDGALFAEHIAENYTKKNPLGERGGKEVDQVERYVFAALLKHAHLVERAIADVQKLKKQQQRQLLGGQQVSSPFSATPFVVSARIKAIWSVAFSVRVWATQQQQSDQGICEQVIAKCTFLLSLAAYMEVQQKPQPKSAQHAFPLRKMTTSTENVHAGRKLVRASTDFGSSKHDDDPLLSSSEQNLKTTYQTYRNLRTQLTISNDPTQLAELTEEEVETEQQDAKSAATLKALSAALVGFVQSKEDKLVETLQLTITRQIERADTRILALTNMSKLLSVCLPSSVYDLLKLVFQGFADCVQQGLSDLTVTHQQHAFHCLGFVHGCGMERRTKLLAAFHGLFTYVTSLLTPCIPPPPPTPTSTITPATTTTTAAASTTTAEATTTTNSNDQRKSESTNTATTSTATVPTESPSSSSLSSSTSLEVPSSSVAPTTETTTSEAGFGSITPTTMSSTTTSSDSSSSSSSSPSISPSSEPTPAVQPSEASSSSSSEPSSSPSPPAEPPVATTISTEQSSTSSAPTAASSSSSSSSSPSPAVPDEAAASTVPTTTTTTSTSPLFPPFSYSPNTSLVSSSATSIFPPASSATPPATTTSATTTTATTAATTVVSAASTPDESTPMSTTEEKDKPAPVPAQPSAAPSAHWNENDDVIKHFILHGMTNLFFSEEDHDLLDKVNLFGRLSEIFEEKEGASAQQITIAHSARSLFWYMAIGAMFNRTSDSGNVDDVIAGAKDLTYVQQAVVDLVYSRVVSSGKKVCEVYHTSVTSDPVKKDAAGCRILNNADVGGPLLQNERDCTEFLELVLLASTKAQFADYFATRRNVSDLFKLYVGVTPRIKRLLLRLFSKVAHAVDPANIFVRPDDKNVVALMPFLVSEITKSFYTNPSSSYGYPDDESTLSILRDYVITEKIRSKYDKPIPKPQNAPLTAIASSVVLEPEKQTGGKHKKKAVTFAPPPVELSASSSNRNNETTTTAATTTARLASAAAVAAVLSSSSSPSVPTTSSLPSFGAFGTTTSTPAATTTTSTAPATSATTTTTTSPFGGFTFGAPPTFPSFSAPTPGAFSFPTPTGFGGFTFSSGAAASSSSPVSSTASLSSPSSTAASTAPATAATTPSSTSASSPTSPAPSSSVLPSSLSTSTPAQPPAFVAPSMTLPTPKVPVRSLWSKPVYPYEGVRVCESNVTKFQIALDAISVIILLFEIPEWSDALTAYVTSVLTNLPDLVSEFKSDPSFSNPEWVKRMHAVIALLYVFGNNNDSIHIGSHVRFSSNERDTGVVVHIDYLLGKSDIIMASNTVRTQIALKDLVSIADVKFKATNFTLTRDLLAHLRPLLTHDEIFLLNVSDDVSDEPDLGVCATLRAHCVVAEARRRSLHALGELFENPASVDAFCQSGLVGSLTESAMKAAVASKTSVPYTDVVSLLMNSDCTWQNLLPYQPVCRLPWPLPKEFVRTPPPANASAEDKALKHFTVINRFTGDSNPPAAPYITSCAVDPNLVPVYYFEIFFATLTSLATINVDVGFATNISTPSASFAANGKIFVREESPNPDQPSTEHSDLEAKRAFKELDIVGCGWNRTDKTVFFTRNGELIDTVAAPSLASQSFYPYIALRSDAQVVANFGQSKFKYDVAAHVSSRSLEKEVEVPDLGIANTDLVHCVGDNLSDETQHAFFGQVAILKPNNSDVKELNIPESPLSTLITFYHQPTFSAGTDSTNIPANAYVIITNTSSELGLRTSRKVNPAKCVEKVTKLNAPEYYSAYGPYRLLYSVYQQAALQFSTLARKASISLLSKASSLNLEVVGGAERFVKFFVTIYSSEISAGTDSKDPRITTLSTMLLTLLRTEAAVAPAHPPTSENDCALFWPAATTVLRACLEQVMIGEKRESKLDPKLSLTMLKLVFEAGSVLFRQFFAREIFEHITTATVALPTIPEGRASLSSDQLLRIEMTKLAAEIAPSLTDVAKYDTLAESLSALLTAHAKDSNHPTYLKPLLDLMLALCTKTWEQEEKERPPLVVVSRPPPVTTATTTTTTTTTTTASSAGEIALSSSTTTTSSTASSTSEVASSSSPSTVAASTTTTSEVAPVTTTTSESATLTAPIPATTVATATAKATATATTEASSSSNSSSNSDNNDALTEPHMHALWEPLSVEVFNDSILTNAKNVYKFCQSLRSKKQITSPFACAAYMWAAVGSKLYTSPHPVGEPYSVMGELISFPGADSMEVVLDSKCEIKEGCQLSFFLNEEHATAAEIDDSKTLQSFKNWRGQAKFVVPADKIYWRFTSTAAEPITLWGFEFTVAPTYGSVESLSRLANSDEHYPKIASLIAEYGTEPALDNQLMHFAYALSMRRNMEPHELLPAHFTLSEDEKQRYPLLAAQTLDRLLLRFAVLRLFNSALMNVIPLFLGEVKLDDVLDSNTDNVPSPSLIQLVFKYRNLVFTSNKHKLVEKSVPNDRPSQPNIQVNRLGVGSSSSKVSIKDTVFEQVCGQLKDLPPTTFMMDSGARAWRVTLVGEGATDAGGPYQEVISQMCRDLQSAPLSLFIPCPNAQVASEEEGAIFNRDKFIPNPSKNTSHDLSLYNFVGKLMGIALRTRIAIPLNLPSILWKPLVGMRPTYADLRAIDHFCCQFLDGLREAAKNGMTEENFDNIIFETFVTSLSDGSQVELKSDGANIPLTFAQRLDYATLVEKARMLEAGAAVGAIRDGLHSVVHAATVALFTWDELEAAICGRPTIEIAHLRENHVRIDGYDKEDPNVKMFWEVFESFTMEERCMFLRFACGRDRLPNNKDFRICITRLYETNVLPLAATCSSTFKLPSYSTKEKMRDKILMAITSCIDIDNDFRV